ncbi:MAG: hypothetical protein WCJ37_02735 [Syntrophus sp. (in: bacteria)]
MSTTKIKIKHGNTEIEIEGSEDFLIKYLNSLGLFKYEKVKDVKTDKKEKKIKQVKKEKVPKGAIYEGVIEALRISKGAGMSADEIAEATTFTKKQVVPALAKAKKNGIIKSSAERGNYEYVKKVDNKKKTELIEE